MIIKPYILLLFSLFLSTSLNSQDTLIQSNNEFTFKLYNAIKPDFENFFISPFSLHIALAVANEGAMSNTRQEIDDLLSVKNLNDRTAAYHTLIQETTDLNIRIRTWLEDTISNNMLFLANSLWIQDKLNIDPNFVDRIKTNYKSDVFSFNKENISEAGIQRNNWISESTNGKISEIKGFDENDMLSILNSIYFNGKWEIPFNPKRTKRRKFNALNKEKMRADFMRRRAAFNYYEDTEIQNILLPYQNDQFSMMIILPWEKYGILNVEKNFNKDYFDKIMKLSSPKEVKLSFPKFLIESELSPKEDLERMGYPIMFSDKADFSGISKSQSLKIGEIIHKTFVEVNEESTEAAATSLAEIVIVGGLNVTYTPPPPKIFKANHPFVFFILDNRTKAILFAGRYAN